MTTIAEGYTHFNPDHLQRASFLTVAALFAQTWDWATLLSDEIEYIWTGKFTLMKAVYTMGRYGILIGQIIHQILTYLAIFHNLPVSFCRVMFMVRTLTSQAAVTCIEIVLLFRVYTLYNQSSRTRQILCGVFIITFGMEYYGEYLMNDVYLQAPSCYPPAAPPVGLALFVSGIIFCQFVVFSLTLVKVCCCPSTCMTPLASLMLKEGAGTMSLVIGVLIPLSVFEVLRNLASTSIEAAFSWYLAMLSVIACRLIIHLRKLAVSARSRFNTEDIDEELERLDPAWS